MNWVSLKPLARGCAPSWVAHESIVCARASLLRNQSGVPRMLVGAAHQRGTALSLADIDGLLPSRPVLSRTHAGDARLAAASAQIVQSSTRASMS